MLMDNIQQAIKTIVENRMHTKVNEVAAAGKGASGSVYCVRIQNEPYVIAVKTSEYYDTMCREKAMLDYLFERVSYKVPQTYFICQKDDVTFLGMEFINGVSGKNEFKLNFIRNKKHLADSIVDAFLDTKSVQSDKFGVFDNPVYDTWKAYYRDFFNDIYSFAKEKFATKEISQTIMNAVQWIEDNFDLIFDSVQGPACLSHGDFWMPNMIVDFKKSELAGVLDPFNMIYAEPEYELFAFTLGFGKRLRLYDVYKKRVKASAFCDLKVELYALCNELHWCMLLGMVNKSYIEFRSKKLMEQARKLNIA